MTANTFMTRSTAKFIVKNQMDTTGMDVRLTFLLPISHIVISL